MIELWPHWLRPGWLLLLPLLVWLGWQLWQRPHRSGRWQALIPEAFHSVLLIGSQQRSTRLPWLALVTGWLLALLALLGPSWQQVENNPVKRADPLVVVLDLSEAMLAADTPPNRLEQARRKLLDLLQARGDAQTGIVVYAGSAHSLVPLSDDLLTSRNLLEALKPSIMPEPGQRADLGVDKARQLLQQGANGQGRILLITSRLTADELDAIRQSLDDSAITLDVLGIGTLEGAPITQADGSFLKDASGGILLPRLEEGNLQQAARENRGRYSRIRLDNQDLDQLQLLERAQSTRQTTEPTRLQLWADAGHWLLLPLLLLAACAGRRGWLLCLPLLLVMPRPVYAFEFMDLWLTPDQQGARLLQKNEPAKAAGRFADPQWQGISLYEAGDYAEAAGRFNQGDRAIDHYNRGNALARNGDLEAAVDAYETALERQSDLKPALQNKALVEDLLRQQKEQQQQQNPADAQPGEQDQQPSAGQSGQNQQGKDPQQTQDESTGKPADRKPASDPQQAQQPDQSDAPSQETQGASSKPEQRPAGDPADGSSQQASGAANEPLSDNPKTPAAQNGKSAEDQTPADTDTNASQPGESAEPLNEENRQALEQWLRQIPDDPAELLRRKFWYEQQQRQENLP